MIRDTLRCRLLPFPAWRALFVVAALALPFRSPIMRAAAAEAQPPVVAAKDGALPKKSKAKNAPKKKPAAKKDQEETRKITAPALIAEIEKGIAVIGKGAKEAKLDPKSPTAAPFFASLKTVANNTETLTKQLAAKDDAYFKTLSGTAVAVGRLRITAPRLGVTNKTVNDGAKIVFDSFDALRGGFGKEAARKKQGGPLTDKERETFAKLKAQQTQLVAKLSPVREKAVKAGNKKLVADLDGLFRQSKMLSSAKDDVNGFALALELFDYLAGQYDAYTNYVPTDYRTDWAYVGPSFKDGGTTYWAYYDTYPVSDWSYYETSSISYSYDYSEVSMSSTEIAEYDSYVEESSVAEVSEETYIEDSSYEESLEANEDEQDSSMEDTEEAIEDDADEDGDEGDADGDEGDADGDEADADGDEADADGDEGDADGDEADADGDEADADGDEGDADGDEGGDE